DADGEVDTNGWDGTDRLDLTLNNGSKWVGAAQSVHQTGSIDVDGDGKGDIATYGVGTEAIILNINQSCSCLGANTVCSDV
ncbi:hypothetical protein OFN36_31510, partial [Escherichia coli]|nr:hypothetical protein [Escherichia coli]